MKGRDLKKYLLKTLLAGTAIFLVACLTDDGPTCDNLTAGATACPDCDATNPEHSACYVAPSCDNTSASGPACNDCDPTNPEHLACQDTFTNAVFPILENNCVGCHTTSGFGETGTGGSDSGLNFVDASVAYERLLMPSFGDSGATMRVVAGDPGASAFYNKISEESDGVWYGDPMPPPISPLINTDPEAVETIRLWIEAGAKGPDAAPKP